MLVAKGPSTQCDNSDKTVSHVNTLIDINATHTEMKWLLPLNYVNNLIENIIIHYLCQLQSQSSSYRVRNFVKEVLKRKNCPFCKSVNDRKPSKRSIWGKKLKKQKISDFASHKKFYFINSGMTTNEKSILIPLCFHLLLGHISLSFLIYKILRKILLVMRV